MNSVVFRGIENLPAPVKYDLTLQTSSNSQFSFETRCVCPLCCSRMRLPAQLNIAPPRVVTVTFLSRHFRTFSSPSSQHLNHYV